MPTLNGFEDLHICALNGRVSFSQGDHVVAFAASDWNTLARMTRDAIRVMSETGDAPLGERVLGSPAAE